MIGSIQSSKTKLLLCTSDAEYRRVRLENHVTISLPRKFTTQRSTLPFLAQAAPRSRRAQPARPQPRQTTPAKIDRKTAEALEKLKQYVRGRSTVAKVTAALTYLYVDGKETTAQVQMIVPLLRRLIKSSHRAISLAAMTLYAAYADAKHQLSAQQIYQCAKDMRAQFTRSDQVVREAAAYHYAVDVAHVLSPKDVLREAKVLRRMFTSRNANTCLHAVYAYRRLALRVDAKEAGAGAKALRKLFGHQKYGVRMYASIAYKHIVPRLAAKDVAREAKALRYLSRSRSARIRKRAARALGALAARHKAARHMLSTKVLLSRLKDRSAAVRKSAAKSIGALARSFSKVQANRVAKAFRGRMLADTNWAVRLAAVEAYEKLFPKLSSAERGKGEDVLKKRMKDGDLQVRAAAVKVYCQKYVPAMNKNQMRAAVDLLIALTGNENTWIQWYAKQALKLIADRVGTKPVSARPSRQPNKNR